jgi:hypothetical protein
LMTKETTKTINLIHLISEGVVVVLYVLGVIPFVYYRLFWIVVPLVALNLVLSFIKKDETLTYTGVNVVMSILAFVPILGWLAIFTGIWMSLMSIQVLNKELGIISSTPKTENPTTEETDVEIKTVKVTKKPKEEKEEKTEITEEKSN